MRNASCSCRTVCVLGFFCVSGVKEVRTWSIEGFLFILLIIKWSKSVKISHINDVLSDIVASFTPTQTVDMKPDISTFCCRKPLQTDDWRSSFVEATRAAITCSCFLLPETSAIVLLGSCHTFVHIHTLCSALLYSGLMSDRTGHLSPEPCRGTSEQPNRLDCGFFFLPTNDLRGGHGPHVCPQSCSSGGLSGQRASPRFVAAWSASFTQTESLFQSAGAQTHTYMTTHTHRQTHTVTHTQTRISLSHTHTLRPPAVQVLEGNPAAVSLFQHEDRSFSAVSSKTPQSEWSDWINAFSRELSGSTAEEPSALKRLKPAWRQRGGNAFLSVANTVDSESLQPDYIPAGFYAFKRVFWRIILSQM